MTIQRGFFRSRIRMTIVLFLTVLSSSQIGCQSPDAKRFQQHINYLADDRLEGRGLGTPGIDDAANYIAKQFAEIGLVSAVPDGSYFQSFPITLNRTLTSASTLTFGADSNALKLNQDYIPLSFSSDESFSGKVLFCGYGIESTEKNHHDFADADPASRVVLMFLGEPPSWADANGFPSRHALVRDKVYNAKDRKALAVLFVNPSPPADGKDELTEFDSEDPDEYGIPAFHVTRAVVDAQLAKAGLPNLSALQNELDAGKSKSMELSGISSNGQAGFQRRTANAKNVVGILKGTSPDGEAIVIGAHYDHLGKRKPMLRRFQAGQLVREKVEPQIHNGADDNASGTSGLIEIARWFAEGPKPQRSIVFIAFSAEEAGLHGSKYYTKVPSIPLSKTVAMLNMDMIGRIPKGKNEVQVFGLDSAEIFDGIVRTSAADHKLRILPGVDSGGRSDHASFLRNRIPSIHFFSGNHSDYHRPSDDSDKINASGGTKIAHLVFDVAEDLANRTDRPTYQESKSASSDQPTPTATFRVVMGLSPNYANDGQPGMGVDGVTSDGPADLAGMKAGDRITRIGDKPVANIYDYMAATRGNSAGDTVDVIVLRNGKEITLKVKLAGTK